MTKILNNWITYFLSIAVFVLSVAGAYVLQVNNIIKFAVIIPGIGGLCLVIYKSWKDELMQSSQNDFILGTASHMAEVVYDKHVIFCERYTARIQKGFQELLRDGVSRNAMIFGRDLVNIRQENSVWLTKEIDENLRLFEQTLITMGAKNGVIEHIKDAEERSKTIKEVYRFFDLVVGNEKAENNEEALASIENIIEYIRDVLGVKTFTTLRMKAGEMALDRLID